MHAASEHAPNSDLHGNVPDQSAVALPIIDVINDLELPGVEDLIERAPPIARRIAALKARAPGMPVTDVNDNFGRWRSDRYALLEHCPAGQVRGRPMVELLQFAANDDYMRDFRLLIPTGCVASIHADANACALRLMAQILKADSDAVR